MFVGVLTGFLFGGGTHWLVTYNAPIHPAWNVFITSYTFTVTYAIFRHKLLGLDLVIQKGIVYTTLIYLITAAYFVLLLVIPRMVNFSDTTLSILLLVVLVLISEPLRRRLQILIDKFFYRGSIEQLAHEKHVLTKEIEKQDKLRAIATFAAGMAHEIKNPLTSIKVFTEHLTDRYDDPEFRANFQRIVSDEIDRVNNIVRQLLEFSKPTNSMLEYLNLGEIINDTLGLLNTNFIENRITVTMENLISTTIRGDRYQLKQVFLNIFLNSIDALPAEGKIDISIRQKDANVEILISDNGCGIEKADLTRIFDPFFTTKADGTGLGLSIVYGIIKQHGGRLEVKSLKSSGTNFKIILPSVDAAKFE